MDESYIILSGKYWARKFKSRQNQSMVVEFSIVNTSKGYSGVWERTQSGTLGEVAMFCFLTR